MSNRIKTTISANTNIFDVNGQWLPKGNYYFCIDSCTRTTAKGELFERSFNAKYEFLLIDLIKMMSIAQARLARRANITDINMPTSSSPTMSPISRPPGLSFSRLRNYIEHTREEINQNRRAPSPKTCTICLENINNEDEKRLVCDHSFHEICINRWLSTNTNCPVCRRFIRNRNNRLPRIRPIPPNREERRNNRRENRRHNRRQNRRSNVRVTPIVTRNTPIITSRSRERTLYNERPISNNRRREYDRIYSSNRVIQ